MREIIFLQCGQCGIQMGTQFWSNIIQEQGLDHSGTPTFGQTDYQKQQLEVYFKMQKDGQYFPRAVLMDLESGSINSARASQYGNLYNPSNLIYQHQGAGSNWAKGYNTNGAELINSTIDSIRQELESCESLQGFQLAHSLGGGTGSGMGTLLTSKLKEEYCNKIAQTFSILPSVIVSDTVTEPYNALLSTNQLIEVVDQTMIFDNQALYQICNRVQKIQNPTYNDLNQVVASTMSNITCSLRFPNIINSDLRKFGFNLIPFPRLHFLVSSFAPLYSKQNIVSQKSTEGQLYQDTLDQKNMLQSSDPRFGRHLCGFHNFRGKVSQSQAATQVMSFGNSNSSYYVEYIPNNIKFSFCDIPTLNYSVSASMIGNNTSVQDNFKTIQLQFRNLFNRRAFLHWYLDEGVEEMEFIEAEINLNDLISEYQQYQDATIEEDSEDEEPTSASQINSALT